MATIGFIGLGNMGTPMAANLIKAGLRVIAFDIVAAKAEALASADGRVAVTVPEAAAPGEIVITMTQTLFAVSAKSSGQCWALTSYCPVPGPVPASTANRGYAPGFTAAMMLRICELSNRRPEQPHHQRRLALQRPTSSSFLSTTAPAAWTFRQSIASYASPRVKFER
jgi:3-hydroxyisobutyrate dehydrogenase-like beta-hydroxyacid dehydrogenase